MKASLNIKAFSNALSIASRAAISGKAVTPVLQCILLTASKEQQRIYLTCTNLDLRISTSVKAEVKESGELCINSTLFTQIVRSLPLESVEISVTKSTIKLQSGSSRFNLHTTSSDEFPPVPVVTGDAKSVQFTQEDLLSRFASVVSAVSTDESRYMLNGVFIDQKATGLRFASTDRRRMHVNSSDCVSEQVSSLTLPSNTVTKLISMLGVGKGVKMTLANRWVKFDVEREEGEVTIYSKVVEGTYPAYEKVIPANAKDGTIKLKRDDFFDAVRRVSLSVSDKNNSVVIKIAGKVLTLSASSPEFGEANEEVECENNIGLETKFAINPSFLGDALNSAEEEFVTVKATSETMPVVVMIGDLLSVIMPSRIS